MREKINQNPVLRIIQALTVCLLLGSVFTPMAHAKEKLTVTEEDIQEGRRCLESKGLIKHMAKFDKLKPEKRDTVNTVGRMNLVSFSDEPLPNAVFYINEETASRTDFAINHEGEVTDFSKLATLPKIGRLCIKSPNWVGLDREALEGKMGLTINFDVLFNNQSGTHSLAELQDGTKDGKSHYKKMFPGPLAVMVPKMTHIGVIYDDENTLAQIEPQKLGQAIPTLMVENFAGMHMFALEDLEALGADGLKVSGGKYWLMPVPSIAKLKKLGFGQDAKSASDAP